MSETPEQVGEEWDQVQMGERLLDEAEKAIENNDMLRAGRLYQQLASLPHGSW